MHAKYEVSISHSSKIIAKVKVDTDRQTDRQDKNNMPPIIRSGGIKIQQLITRQMLKLESNSNFKKSKNCIKIYQLKISYFKKTGLVHISEK